MPSGYGVYDGGRSTRAEEKVLAALAAPASKRPDDLVRAASGAVARLLAAGALRSKDILKPYSGVIAIVVTGRRVTVRYFVSDDSGRVSADVTLSRGAQVLATVRVPSHAASLTKTVRQTIALPPVAVAARTKVCVTAVDPAGNRSTPSCMKV